MTVERLRILGIFVRAAHRNQHRACAPSDAAATVEVEGTAVNLKPSVVNTLNRDINRVFLTPRTDRPNTDSSCFVAKATALYNSTLRRFIPISLFLWSTKFKR